MNKIFSEKSTFLLFLLSLSISNMSANTTSESVQNDLTTTSNIVENQNPVENTEASEAVDKDTIEELKKLILKMITEVDFALETLATYISSDDVTPEDKEQALDNIRELRRGVSTVARDIMMYADMASLTRSMKFIVAVQEHVKNAVSAGLHEFAQFDVEALQLRSVVEADPEEMKEEVKALNDDLEQIKKNAEAVGITTWNKIYRNSLDRFIIEPCAKRGWHKKVAWSAFIAAAGTYFWYRFSEDAVGCRDEDGELLQLYSKKGNPLYQEIPELVEEVDKATGEILRDENGLALMKATGRILQIPLRVSGPNPHTEGWYQWFTEYLYPKANGKMRATLGRTHFSSYDAPECDQTFYNGIARGKLGRFDTFLTAFNSGSVALGTMVFWPQISEFYKKNISPNLYWLEKKAFDFHCWNKGGIYYKNNKYKSHKPFMINPRFRFDDIIGCKDFKNVGYKIIEYIKDPEKFQRQNIVPPKGILLHGPPGTGKSYCAEALCGEVIDALKEDDKDEKDFGFYIIKSTHIQQLGLEAMLSLMKQWAPCIVFIDEIDLLSLQRDRNPERLAEFLSGMSGFLSEADPKKQVIIIGATNKLENVDRAVTRAGRLNKLMYLDYPTFDDRYEFMVRSLGDRINPDLFDLEKIARQTGGCTIEDLRLIINAALFKTRVHAQPLTQKDLEDALNSEVRKIVMHQELDLSTEEQRILAIHMAGHAVAHMHLPTQKLLSAMTIKPTTEKMREESVWHQYYKQQDPGQIYGKIFTYCPHDSVGTSNTQILLNECKILLAGRLAEKVLLDSISSNNKRTCSGTCKPNAFNIAKQILLDGIDEDQLSKTMKEEILTNAHKLVHELEKEVEALLEQQKPLLMFIADALIEQKTVTYDDIMLTLQMAYEQAAKENPELIKELEKQMLEQANAQVSGNGQDVRQAISDELGIQEETVAA